MKDTFDMLQTIRNAFGGCEVLVRLAASDMSIKVHWYDPDFSVERDYSEKEIIEIHDDATLVTDFIRLAQEKHDKRCSEQ